MASTAVRGRARGRRGGGMFGSDVTEVASMLGAYEEKDVGKGEAQEPNWKGRAELSMCQSHVSLAVDATSKWLS